MIFLPVPWLFYIFSMSATSNLPVSICQFPCVWIRNALNDIRCLGPNLPF